MESLPPESARATRTGRGRTQATRAAVASSTAASTKATGSAGIEFLELAMTQKLVLARLEQRVRGLILQLPKRLCGCLLQVDHHSGVVAMRPAERLVDHLLDQPEGLQARRGDA